MRLSRREMFKLSAAAPLMASVPWFNALQGHAQQAATQGRTPAKQCILLWCGGGPSQAHSFDPRPGEEAGMIQTNVPGLHFSSYIPRLAQRMQWMSLLKTMNHPNFGHGDAVIWMQTGYRNRDGGVERPSLGSIVTHAIGQPGAELPNYIVIDPSGAEGIFSINGGHLGPRYNPLKVLTGTSIPDQRPEGAVTVDEVLGRASLLDRMNQSFLQHNHTPVAVGHQTSLHQALAIMRTSKTRAFNLDEEPLHVRARYGADRMGRACLLARRLVEVGVPFVAAHVTDGLGNGWDTHMDAPNRNRQLFENLDVAASALLDDLHVRGMLDSTLVIIMGEFGRSRDGINHNNRIWTAVLAGGGLRHGQEIGNTGPDGRTLTDYRALHPGDLFATVLRALGIDHRAGYTARGNRPLDIVHSEAEPVEELF